MVQGGALQFLVLTGYADVTLLLPRYRTVVTWVGLERWAHCKGPQCLQRCCAHGRSTVCVAQLDALPDLALLRQAQAVVDWL